MAWLKDMRQHKTDFEWYVVRRVDTGQYFKKLKSGFMKGWKPDDPRRKRWTDDVELATTYTKQGIKQAIAVAKTTTSVWDAENTCWVPQSVEMEVVTLKVHVEAGYIPKEEVPSTLDFEEPVPSTLDFLKEDAMYGEEVGKNQTEVKE